MLDFVEIGIYREFWNNVNIIECVINLFLKFFCFVLIYYLEIRICNVECINVLNVLENVILINFVINFIIFFCFYNRGMFVCKLV